MSSIGTIWTYPTNPRVMKVIAAAALNGRTVDYAPDFTMDETNRAPEFVARWPTGKVPTFRTTDGLCIFESDAIAQYAAESGPSSGLLLGETPEARAVIRQWILFADHELQDPLTTKELHLYGILPRDKAAEDKILDRVIAALAVLEAHLESREYVASNVLNLADLSIAAGLYWGFECMIDKELRAQFTRTTAWYLRVIQDERVKSAFGEPVFVDVRQ